MKYLITLLVFITFPIFCFGQEIANGNYKTEKSKEEIFPIVLKTIPQYKFSIKNINKESGTITASQLGILTSKEFASLLIKISKKGEKTIIDVTFSRNPGFLGGGSPKKWIVKFGEILKKQINDLSIEVIAQTGCENHLTIIDNKTQEKIVLWPEGAAVLRFGCIGKNAILYCSDCKFLTVYKPEADNQGRVTVGESSYAQTQIALDVEKNKNLIEQAKQVGVSKEEKLIIVTAIGDTISLNAARNFKGDYTPANNEIKCDSWYFFKKSELLKLQKEGFKSIKYVMHPIDNPNVVEGRYVYDNENNKLIQHLTCFMNSDEYQQCNDIPIPILSSEEAITELKKAKEKLDLNLINQQQYDSIKAEMRKFIK